MYLSLWGWLQKQLYYVRHPPGNVLSHFSPFFLFITQYTRICFIWDCDRQLKMKWQHFSYRYRQNKPRASLSLSTVLSKNTSSLLLFFVFSDNERRSTERANITNAVEHERMSGWEDETGKRDDCFGGWGRDSLTPGATAVQWNGILNESEWRRQSWGGLLSEKIIKHCVLLVFWADTKTRTDRAQKDLL